MVFQLLLIVGFHFIVIWLMKLMEIHEDMAGIRNESPGRLKYFNHKKKMSFTVPAFRCSMS